MSVEWRGDEVQRKIQRAARDGINAVMARAVIQAKSNHPGWKNRTAVAEGSVRIIRPATADGDRIAGLWGSAGVVYVKFLEFLHGSFLRNAADATHPTLDDEIRRRLK